MSDHAKCEICGVGPVQPVVVEPARFGERNGKKYLVQAEIRALLCTSHRAAVWRDPSPARTRAQAAAWSRYWRNRQGTLQ